MCIRALASYRKFIVSKMAVSRYVFRQRSTRTRKNLSISFIDVSWLEGILLHVVNLTTLLITEAIASKDWMIVNSASEGTYRKRWWHNSRYYPDS